MTLDLNATWFLLFGVLLAGYAVLDGFDLGVGAWHLFARKDEERRVLLNAIGPIWDGNQVWLVTAGGALFAAFPEVYATVLSGFYLAFMLLLFGLIFRAVSIKFRSKEQWTWWRNFWDVAFSVSSTVSSIIFGVALGNLILGIPMNDQHEYTGTFLELLNPYSLLVGVTTLAIFMMHGAIFLYLKTEGDLQKQASGWTRKGIAFFLTCFGLTTISTILYIPHMTQLYREVPPILFFPVLSMLAVMGVPYYVYRQRYDFAFLSSAATILCLLILVAIGLYPNMVLSSLDPANSLDIYNAASTQKTLWIMLIIAMIGMPLVIAYTGFVYYVFRGKVKMDSMSY